MVPTAFRFSLLCAVSLAVLAGCASAPVSVDAAVVRYKGPALTVGSKIPLDQGENLRVAAEMDQRGRVHLLVSRLGASDVYYVLVSRSGDVIRKRIPGTSRESKLDIAVESNGAVHALIGERHFVLEGNEWRTIGRVPCQRIAFSRDKLICAFTVSGDDVNAPGHWELFGMGAMGAAIFLPLPVQAKKLVLVTKTEKGWSRWTVVDPESKELVRGFSLAADSLGNAHVAYGSSITSDVRQLRYARIQVKLIDREPAPSESDKPVFTSVQGRVVGKPLSKYLPRRTSFDRYFFSVDPRTGDAMAISAGCEPTSYTLGDAVTDESVMTRGRTDETITGRYKSLVLSDCLAVRTLAPAGDKHFYAFAGTKDFPSNYTFPANFPGDAESDSLLLVWDGHEWSASASLNTSQGSQWGHLYSVGNGTGMAFLISVDSPPSGFLANPWTGKLVGRWIQRSN